jgi:hypothetical protein
MKKKLFCAIATEVFTGYIKFLEQIYSNAKKRTDVKLQDA